VVLVSGVVVPLVVLLGNRKKDEPPNE